MDEPLFELEAPSRPPGEDRAGCAPPFLLAPVGMGFAGFIAGFLGPIALHPGANQGPLFGIFISGPAGFLVGVLMGIVVKLIARKSKLRAWTVLAGAIVAAAAIALAVVALSDF